MAGYVIHFPGAYLGDDVLVAAENLRGTGERYASYVGPAGEGVVVHWQNSAVPTQWTELGAYHLGWNDRDEPTPSCLERERMHEGERVMLGDGNLWKLAAIRHVQTRLRYRAGKLSGTLSEEFSCIEQQCFRLRSELSAYGLLEDIEGDARMASVGDASAVLFKALTANYRLTERIACALGLINGRSLMGAVLGILGQADSSGQLTFQVR